MIGRISRYALPLLLLIALLGCSRASRRTPKTSSDVNSSGGFPVTLTGAQRETVTVTRRPTHLLSLAPTITEILFAIGAGKQVAAVTAQCTYPSEVKRLPNIGQWWEPSTERALALQPDLAIGQRGNPPAFLEALRKFGCPVYTIDPRSLPDIFAAITHLGTLTGNETAAQRVVSDMHSRLDAIKARVADVPERKRPTAFIVIQISPVWTAGKHTFQDEAIRAAGAVNVGDSVTDFKEFSIEKLIASDPDFLLVTTMAGDPNQMKRDIEQSPVLKRLTAVREDRILVLDADEIDRPGPRLVNAIETMARTFYPDRFTGGKG